MDCSGGPRYISTDAITYKDNSYKNEETVRYLPLHLPWFLRRICEFCFKWKSKIVFKQKLTKFNPLYT